MSKEKKKDEKKNTIEIILAFLIAFFTSLGILGWMRHKKDESKA